uniref:Oxidoreductase n=1 Tax=Haemonchus contortus TaxID=6289 RepID=A0A7I4YJ85_HAECO
MYEVALVSPQDMVVLGVNACYLHQRPLPTSPWTLRKQVEHAASVTEHALERTMLGVSLYPQVQQGIRSSELRHRTKVRDAVDNAKKSKIRWAEPDSDDRWARAVTDWIPRDVK